MDGHALRAGRLVAVNRRGEIDPWESVFIRGFDQCPPRHVGVRGSGALAPLDAPLDDDVEEVRSLTFASKFDPVGKALEIAGCNQPFEARILHIPKQRNTTNTLGIACAHSSSPLVADRFD